MNAYQVGNGKSFEIYLQLKYIQIIHYCVVLEMEVFYSRILFDTSWFITGKVTRNLLH